MFVFLAARALVLEAAVGAEAGCLADGIPTSSRKDLQRGGETFPVGLWVNAWSAGYAMAELVQIIIQEVLGFNVEQKGPGGSAPVGFYAMAGCAAPANLTHPECGAEQTYVHVNVEAWAESYGDLLAALQATEPMAPKSLGNMGYFGTSSMFVSNQIREEAYAAEGVSLDFYRDYNTSWRDIAKYFSAPTEGVDTSRLLPCSQTLFMDPALMRSFLQVTGDEEGVVREGSNIRAKCFDGFFWYPAACRQDPSSCANLFTGGSGWSLHEFMQKAASFNMPISLAVAATWDDFTSLPQDHTSLLYWWWPDPTYLSMRPHQVVFPPNDAAAWAGGDFRTGQIDQSVDKQVSPDLNYLAPDIEAMLKKFHIDPKMVDSILLDWLETSDPWQDVACRWLRANRAIWESWIPDKSECFAGFGMYDQRNEVFVQERSDPTFITCRVCPAGYASVQLIVGTAITHVCRRCEAGTYQASAASSQCQPCPTGEYQDEEGQVSCKRCIVGFYQNESGGHTCKACPAGTTTLGFASLSIAECGCRENTINTANGSSFECRTCGKGLRCPFASTVASLQEGQADLGEDYVPEVISGYYSSKDEPMSLWECKPMSNCPGGKPDSCHGGLQGRACSRCPEGQSFGTTCTECPSHVPITWSLGLLVALLGIAAGYYFVNTEVSPHLTPLKAGFLSVTLTIKVFQAVAIFGIMTLVWSPEFETTSGSLQTFMLDVKHLSVSCIVGPGALSTYLMSTSLCPAALLWLLMVYLASHLRSQAWKGPWVANLMGKLCDAGFGAMAALAMQTLMCYLHPNGRRSLLHHNDVVCGDHVHLIMALIGAALGTLVMSFVALCVYAAWNLPSWSSAKRTGLTQSCRFLYADFRLDCWWFGLLLLFRNLGFSAAIVLATDLAAAQVAIASIILVIYGYTQAATKPWKAPLINFMDSSLAAGLLLLIGNSRYQDPQVSEQFARVAILVTMIFILVCLVVLFLLSWISFLLTQLGRDGAFLLRLRGRVDSAQLAKALRGVVEELAAVEDLEGWLDGLNVYDVARLVDAMILLSALRRSELPSSNSRLSLRVLNSRPSVQARADRQMPEASRETDDVRPTSVAQLRLTEGPKLKVQL